MEVGEVKFPFSEAFRFTLESIRKRFTRAMITAISVILSVAFYGATRSMGVIYAELLPGSATIQVYQVVMAVIALVVCTVGILNSMLMAVTERTKEIGTMKCLGAMDSHILTIFLLEAALIGLLGGLIGGVAGLIVGIASTWGQVAGMGSLPVLSLILTLTESLGISILLSIGATLYPAYYAAKLNPAEALRFEV
ncbi:MAG: FtsX-like permease family protein [Candidatus Bathyarchaeia archaeon]